MMVIVSKNQNKEQCARTPLCQLRSGHAALSVADLLWCAYYCSERWSANFRIRRLRRALKCKLTFKLILSMNKRESNNEPLTSFSPHERPKASTWQRFWGRWPSWKRHSRNIAAVAFSLRLWRFHEGQHPQNRYGYGRTGGAAGRPCLIIPRPQWSVNARPNTQPWVWPESTRGFSALWVWQRLLRPIQRAVTGCIFVCCPAVLSPRLRIVWLCLVAVLAVFGPSSWCQPGSRYDSLVSTDNL